VLELLIYHALIGSDSLVIQQSFNWPVAIIKGWILFIRAAVFHKTIANGLNIADNAKPQ